MFNSSSQSAALLIPAWKELGLNEFRFEALYEVKDKICTYARLIKDDCSTLENEDLVKKLGVLKKYGLSEKAFDNKEYKNKKTSLTKQK
jgi:hypothetical protein